MFTCEICRFDVQLDDRALRRGPAGCVCVACYARTTGHALRMPKTLRREINTILDKMLVSAD